MEKLENKVEQSSPNPQGCVKVAGLGAAIVTASAGLLGYSFAEVKGVLDTPHYISFLGIAGAAGLAVGAPMVIEGLKEAYTRLSNYK